MRKFSTFSNTHTLPFKYFLKKDIYTINCIVCSILILYHIVPIEN